MWGVALGFGKVTVHVLSQPYDMHPAQEYPRHDEVSGEWFEMRDIAENPSSTPAAQGSRFCIHCGREPSPDANFCDYCGGNQELVAL
jgi:hypothetical protein